MRLAKFFVDDRHAWLDNSHPEWGMINIGADGSNLTVVFLSMNRATLSIRLVQSFIEHVPQFGGRFLIADNGSDDAQLVLLEGFLAAKCPFPYEILRFGKNYGVAGGRNRAFAEVKTDWILSLDNDIFLIGNPFPTLSRDIGLLGCHFLSVPLLNSDRQTFLSFGGHLSPSMVERHHPFLETGFILPPGSALSQSTEIAPDGSGFLCSFLFGGASILKRDTFLSAGKFDDGMFIGFEDLEFSLRLFRQGLKVGSSAVAVFVHDHPPAAATSDRNCEKSPYAQNTLHESAAYFERKHGFRVWNTGVEEWLSDQERQQGLQRVPADSTPMRETPADGHPWSAKRRIALVVDLDNWAFANIARQIAAHLADRYEFEIVSLNRLGEMEIARWKDRGSPGQDHEHTLHAFARFLLRALDFDLVHVFWRLLLTMLVETDFNGDSLGRYAEFLGLSRGEFHRRFVAPACFTTSVYDHLFLDDKSMEWITPVFTRYAAGYTVASPRLDRTYRRIPQLPDPTAVIPDGVDPALFHPKRLERFADYGNREIVVGWVGNSSWASGIASDSKGVHTILVPSINQLQEEGMPVKLNMADRNECYIPHHEMVEYYASIDVLVCVSDIEGTPNPVLEAMACGVPIISTDVGIVPDALGHEQSRFILKERSVACLKEALRRLIAHRDLLRMLSQENLEQAAAWHWRVQTEKFDAFFSQVIEARRRATGEVRTKMCMLPFTIPSQEPDGSIRLC